MKFNKYFLKKAQYMHTAHPPSKARQVANLLHISTDIDIVGDVSVTAENLPELIAWSELLDNPMILAWRAIDSGARYLHLSGPCERAPVRGHITVTLPAEQHHQFWKELFGGDDLSRGTERRLYCADLATACQAMPTTTTAA